MKLCYKIGLKLLLQISEAFNDLKFYTDSFFQLTQDLQQKHKHTNMPYFWNSEKWVQYLG